MPPRNFGPAVRAFRQHHDLKLTWFARRAGMAPSQLSVLERGRRRARPRAILSVASACRAVGASTDELAHLFELGVTELAQASVKRQLGSEDHL